MYIQLQLSYSYTLMYNLCMASCKNCTVILSKHINIYCSNKCQAEYQYRNYIEAWKAGKVNGSRGKNAKNMSRHIRRYLLEKYSHCCSNCGWNKTNPVTHESPLEIDHIDGDSENNNEDNLRLLCPNCHSLTPSYRNLNRGMGREWRREKYVKII